MGLGDGVTISNPISWINQPPPQMVLVFATDERYGALLLPNLIDLIIIFEKLGDGDPSAVFALMR